MARTVRNLLRLADGARSRADGGKSGIGRGYGGARVDMEKLSTTGFGTQQAITCRTDHLDLVVGRHQGAA